MAPRTESNDTPIYACTLTAKELPDRAALYERMHERLLARSRLDDGLRLDFALGSRELVDAFVEAESRCCAFFEFAVSEDASGVHLDISGPPEAGPLLDRAAEVFDPAAPRETRQKVAKNEYARAVAEGLIVTHEEKTPP